MAAHGRFVRDYIVNNKVPCVPCNKWISAANDARHYKGHGLTTEEHYEQYKDQIYKMVEDQTGDK